MATFKVEVQYEWVKEVEVVAETEEEAVNLALVEARFELEDVIESGISRSDFTVYADLADN